MFFLSSFLCCVVLKAEIVLFYSTSWLPSVFLCCWFHISFATSLSIVISLWFFSVAKDDSSGYQSFCTVVCSLGQWHLWLGSIETCAAADTFGNVLSHMQAGGSSVVQGFLAQIAGEK